MDLAERLASYEVTAAPPRGHLRLVWSEAAPPLVAADESFASWEGHGASRLALLDDYRITRIPSSLPEVLPSSRAAS